MSFIVEGNDCQSAESGGYVILSLDGSELHMTGVPAPHFGADNLEESVVENYDEIEDDEGNLYTINICSSSEGVDWIVEVQALQRELESVLRNRLSVSYRAGSSIVPSSPVNESENFDYNYDGLGGYSEDDPDFSE